MMAASDLGDVAFAEFRHHGRRLHLHVEFGASYAAEVLNRRRRALVNVRVGPKPLA